MCELNFLLLALKNVNQNAYVAGWGATSNVKCITDSKGPNRYLKCRFPFEYQEDIVNDGACVKGTSPSAEDPICKNFYDYQKTKKYERFTKKGPVKVIINKKTRKLCYSFKSGKHGWCGTCDRKAKEGEMGYCGNTEMFSENADEIPVVTASTRWGFCTEACEKEVNEPDVLQEARLRGQFTHRIIFILLFGDI